MELAGLPSSIPFGLNVIDAQPSESAMVPAAVLPLPIELDPEAACAPIAGEAPVVRAVDVLLRRIAARRIVIAVAEPYRGAVADAVAADVTVLGVDPASDWRRAVQAGLEELAPQPLSPILVHDWRHPLVPVDVVERVLEGLAAGHRIVVPVTAMTDSVKQVGGDGAVLTTIDRSTLHNAQYPRGFAAATLADLLTRDADPVAAAAGAGEPVATVDGHADAGRFTLPADAALLEAIIATRR